MPKLLAFGTGKAVVLRIISEVPGTKAVFPAFVTCVGEDWNTAVLQGLFGNPGCFVARVHDDEFCFWKSTCYLVIHCIPCCTVIYISSCYVYPQNPAMPVAGSVSLICKLPLVLSLYKHSTVRISSGHGFAHRSTAGWFIIVVLLPQLLPFRRHFLP